MLSISPNLIFLSAGSNLGNKNENILNAFDLMLESNVINSGEISSLYSSEPVGISEQPWFVNAVISGYTYFSPEYLLYILKSTEYLLGRKIRPRWHEREIDIDILFYENMIIKSNNLEIPHQSMHLRRFVLVPFAELSPTFIHPIFQKSIMELLDECKDNSNVIKL